MRTAILTLAAFALLAPAASAASGSADLRVAISGTTAKTAALPAVAGSPVALTGSVSVVKGKRRATLTALRVSVTAKTVSLSALLGHTRTTLASGKPKGYKAGSVPTLTRTSLTLTTSGARVLGKALHTTLRSGRAFGTIALTPPAIAVTPAPITPTPVPAATPAPAPAATTPTPTTPADTTPTETTPAPGPPTDPPADPFSDSCPITAVSGAPAVGSPTPEPAEPTLSATTPATAGSATWGFKASFRSYVLASAPTSSIFAFSPASFDGSLFAFPTSDGAVTDTATAPVRAVLHEQGTGVFCHKAHGFRISLADPTIVIDGASSYLSAAVGENSSGQVLSATRAIVARLDASGITPVYDGSAHTITWTNIPATLAADVQSVFGGFYATGTALDPVTVVAQLSPN